MNDLRRRLIERNLAGQRTADDSWGFGKRSRDAMSVKIVYVLECHCGGEATSGGLHLDNPQPDGSIRIDVYMAVSQQDFACDDCGCVLGTGDVDYETASAGDGCDDGCDDADGL